MREAQTVTESLVESKESQIVKVWEAEDYGQDAGVLEGFGNYFRVGLQIDVLSR